MDQNNQYPNNPMARPVARTGSAPMPIQRGNFGIPVRQSAMQPPLSRPAPAAPAPAVTPEPAYSPPAPVQTVQPEPAVSAPIQPVQPAAPIAQPAVAPPVQPVAAAPAGPRVMDIAMPQPMPQASQAPVQSAFQSNDIVAPVAQPAQRPLFTPSPATETKVKASNRQHRFGLATIISVSLTVVAAALLVGGVARWISAGSTTNDTIAVGAVSANDGRTMTIQFTATDGKLHKYTTASDADLIPGSATELAYRSGAPEATVRQVSIVKNAKNLGVLLITVGIGCFGIVGIIAIIKRLKSHGKHRSTGLTTPVTA